VATATKRRAGRRKGVSSGKSRAALLASARQLFAKHGFNNTTIRAIAKKAGVDPALVNYFFESKAKLFEVAIELPVDPGRVAAVFAQPAAGPIGERIARFFLTEVFTSRNHAIAAMIRAAVADPGAIPSLRATIEKRVVSVIASALPGPDARLRAELMGSYVVGLFISRHIVRVEPLASASADEIARLIGPAVEIVLGLH
jgi:AcrR family transcriptional regulator